MAHVKVARAHQQHTLILGHTGSHGGLQSFGTSGNLCTVVRPKHPPPPPLPSPPPLLRARLYYYSSTSFPGCRDYHHGRKAIHLLDSWKYTSALRKWSIFPTAKVLNVPQTRQSWSKPYVKMGQFKKLCYNSSFTQTAIISFELTYFYVWFSGKYT